MIVLVYIMIPSTKNSQNYQVKRWTKDDKHYNSKKYTHYGRRGHTIDECHRLHGFP